VFSKITIIWCDNIAAKSIAKNAIFHSRTKYIKIDAHFVTKRVKKIGEVEIRYIPTQYQTIDILTKGLPRGRFLFLCNKLCLTFSPNCVVQDKLQQNSKKDDSRIIL